MKLPLSIVAVFALCLSVFGANPSFQSFNTNDFTVLPSLAKPQTIIANRTNSGTTNILINSVIINTNTIITNVNTTIINTNVTQNIDNSTLTITNSFITITNTVININGNTNLFAADLWTNQFGTLLPVDPIVPVVVPHLLSDGRLSVQPFAYGLNPGTNLVPELDQFSQLYLYTTETNPANVIVNLTDGYENVQHLDIFSYTNVDFLALGQWTLPANSTLPGGGLVKLLGDVDWIGGNGRGISLRYIQPNWVEIGRWNDFTGTVGTGDHNWTNNAGILQPVDPTLPVVITNTITANEGFFYGTNAVSMETAGPISLEGLTNRIGDNGTTVTYNGVPIGASLWTNDVGVLHPIDLTLPVMITNRLQFGQTNVVRQTSTDLVFTNLNNFGTFFRISSDGVNYANYGVNGNVAKIQGPLAIYLEGASSGVYAVVSGGSLSPSPAAGLSLGTTSLPWNALYATNGIFNNRQQLQSTPYYYTNIVMTNLASGNNDLWVVPTGYKAVPVGFLCATTNDLSSNAHVALKSGGNYYRLGNNGAATTNTTASLNSSAFVFEQGDTVAINSTLTGTRVRATFQMLPMSDPLKTYRLLSISSGANTFHTATKTETSPIRSGLISQVGVILYVSQESGGPLIYGFQVDDFLTHTNKSVTSGLLQPVNLDQNVAGDVITINSNSSDATQAAWMTVFEVP